MAAFDFDGTLTRSDSLLPFLWRLAGTPRFVGNMVLLAPPLLAWRMGLISRSAFKTRVLQRFLAGMRESDLLAHAQQFASGSLPQQLRPEALARLRWHQARGHRCVIVSASLECYLRPWAVSEGVTEVLATRLQMKDGVCLGGIEGENCRGAEKVRRLQHWLGEREGWQIYAYGDSAGDREMLAWADRGWYRRMPAAED